MHQEIIVYDGHKYRLLGRYYRTDDHRKGGPGHLHRAIWITHHGPVPQGFEVHHKDGDTFNNAIENLELIERIEHRRQHMKRLHETGKFREWHRSAKGKAWHRRNGIQSWKTRKRSTLLCQECGQRYATPYPTRSLFCTQICGARARRRHNYGGVRL